MTALYGVHAWSTLYGYEIVEYGVPNTLFDVSTLFLE